MLIFAWILATVFFIYLSIRRSSTIAKIIFAILAVVIQFIILFMIFVGFMLDDVTGFALADLLILELLGCSLYRCRNISYKELLLGFISLALLGIWQYFYGTVISQLEYVISDAGGMHAKVPYVIYRWNTYILDVAYPWFIIFNIFISPYWGRYPDTGNYWIKLISQPGNSEKQ